MKLHSFGQKGFLCFGSLTANLKKWNRVFFSTAYEAVTAQILGLYLSQQSDSDKFKFLSAIFLPTSPTRVNWVWQSAPNTASQLSITNTVHVYM